MKNYNEIIKGSPDKIQQKLEDWVMSLSKQNLKSATIRAKLNAVELFLEMNKKHFHKKVLHRLIPSDDYVRGGDIPFTNEDIQLMQKSATKHRTRAIIHFLASTGSRPGGFSDPPLRMKHLVDIEHDCKAIKIYDESKEGFWAFLTPEASKSLDEYFQTRKINGEKLPLSEVKLQSILKNISSLQTGKTSNMRVGDYPQQTNHIIGVEFGKQSDVLI